MSNNNHRILILHNYPVALKVGLGLASLGTMIWAVCKLLLPCNSQNIVCPELPWDIVPVLIGFGFWIVGLSTWFKHQPKLLIVFFFVVSGALSSGLLSAFGDENAGRLFYIILVWLAPITIHAHFVWVKPTLIQVERVVLLVFYGLAIAQSIPLVCWTLPELRAFGWFSILHSSTRLVLITAILATAAFLSSYIRRCEIDIVCSRVRMVFLGLVLGLAPLISLSILPSLLRLPFIPAIYNFPWLIFIPLSYSYVIYRRRFVQIEGYLSRTIVYYLTSIFLVSSYLVAYGILERFVPGWRTSWIVAGGILGAGILLLVTPLRRLFRQWVAWFLYGSEKASIDLVSRMTNSLALVTDQETLCDQLINKLGPLLAVQGSLMFLGNEADGFLLEGGKGFPDWEREAGVLKVGGNDPLVLRLKSIAKPVETEIIKHELNSMTIVTPELMKEFPAACLWLPLLSGDEMLGLLVLMPETSKEYFTYEDRKVLSILARQAGITAHNVQLVEDIRNGRDELSRSHKQLLLVRDDERKHLARELHDQIIQNLTGVDLRFSTLKKNSEGNTADQISETQLLIRDSITRLRSLCSELRQPVFEDLGFDMAVKSFVDDFQKRTNLKIDLFLENDYGELLSDDIELCAYRVLQEALMNVQKHARAQQVEIRLIINASQLELMVKDDGRGFQVPKDFDMFIEENHFGLAGLQERSKMVNGKINLTSTPSKGCNLALYVPLNLE